MNLLPKIDLLTYVELKSVEPDFSGFVIPIGIITGACGGFLSLLDMLACYFIRLFSLFYINYGPH